MAKEEIAHDKQFLLSPQCFQIYLIIKLSIMESFHVFVNIFSKAFAAELLYVGKGYKNQFLSLCSQHCFFFNLNKYEYAFHPINVTIMFIDSVCCYLSPLHTHFNASVAEEF